MKNLVIVESPAKAKTINKILGKDFIVKASVGHVKDLPEKNLGVDVKKDFAPQYVVIPGKEKIIRELKKASKEAEKIYLAPDPDREGEAIAWHIATEIADKKSKTLNDRIYRIIFNEITTRAVQEAIQNPEKIDMNKVEAQQARRILDRLVGYGLSPLYPFLYFKKSVTGGSRSGFILGLPSVLSGTRSLVGPPDAPRRAEPQTKDGTASELYLGRPGLTGLVQLQGDRALSGEEWEQYNLYYAKNQSIALDLEILLKTLLQARRD